MTPAVAICRAASACEAALANPWALPAYVVVRIVMALTLSDQVVTVAQSDFANLALILMAIAGLKRSAKLEKQVEALAQANPDVDDAAIERAVG